MSTGGTYVAYRLYGRVQVADAAADPLRKLYFDELYGATIVRGTLALSRVAAWFDAHIIDGTVNTVGKITVVFSLINRWIDT
jgi:hypothetical protein